MVPLPVPDARKAVHEFALTLPEAWEDHPWNEVVVKVCARIFVFLGSQGFGRITVKLVESHAHALSIEGAAPSAYGLGKSGWVTVPVEADGVDLDLLRDLVEESYRIVAPRTLVAELDARPGARSGS